MRHFIYFRNKGYAMILAEKYQNSFIKESESEIMGINPLDDDVYLIDAHNGQSDMSELGGLNLALGLIRNIKSKKVKVFVFSWFSKEFIEKSYRSVKELRLNDNVEFIQLP